MQRESDIDLFLDTSDEYASGFREDSAYLDKDDFMRSFEESLR